MTKSQEIINKLSFNGYLIVSNYISPANPGSAFRTLLDDASTLEKLIDIQKLFKMNTERFPSAEDMGKRLIDEYLACQVTIRDNHGNIIWQHGDELPPKESKK